jgi:glycogen operon protein
MLRYFQRMIAFRKAHPSLSRPLFYAGDGNEPGMPDVRWHGTILNRPGFDDPEGRVLACTIAGFGAAPDLHVMMNMFWEPLDFEVPAYTHWRIAIDTFSGSPLDIRDSGSGPPLTALKYTVQGRAIVVLTSTAP